MAMLLANSTSARVRLNATGFCPEYGDIWAAADKTQNYSLSQLNGAHFLEDLRQIIGDSAFFDFLKDCARQEAHKIAAEGDFFRILREHTQADLRPLLAKYFQPDQ